MKKCTGKWGLLFLLVAAMGLTACGGSDGDGPGEDVNPPQTEPGDNTDGPDGKTAVFARGADVSWLTEMESQGRKFYDRNGNATECMALLKSLGINAIRLRVWVNPEGGWNAKDDVVAKAERAHKLGLRVMVDFHYSDTWADPGKQGIPAAWSGYDISKMKSAVAVHTKDVLQALKDRNVDVGWVQVGNETNNGMLWPTGQADKSMANYAALTTAGYDASKTVYPDAKVIVHVSNGHKIDTFKWIFDGLKANGGKWDVIGMSLYPDEDSSNNWYATNWSQQARDCLANVKTLSSTYGTEVMVCEIGIRWDDPNAANFVKAMVNGAEAIDKCLGVFYWEPQCYGGWNGYNKGAFDNSGKPTQAMFMFTPVINE